MNICGVDFGNSNCVIGISNSNGVDTIKSDNTSSPVIPTIITYLNERRYFGEFSFKNQIKYTQNTITDLIKLINLKYDSPEREKLSTSIFFNLVKLEDGTVGIKILYREKDVILRPEQCIAYLFKEFKDIISDYEINHFVIAINPQITESQRRSIISSCKLAKVNCSSLINTSTANSISYMMQNRSKLPTKKVSPSPSLTSVVQLRLFQ